MEPWISSPNKLKKSILTISDGINQSVEPIEIKDSQATTSTNVDSLMYPTLQTILGNRQFSQHFGVISKIFKYQDNLYITNGSGIYKQEGEFFSVIYASGNDDQRLWDAALFFDGTKMYFTDGFSQLKEVVGNSVTTVDDSPDEGSFVTTHSNRFFIASRVNNNLKYSALRDATDWSDTDLNVGSGTIIVETADGEKPTGLTSFADHVILFKKYTMHKLYGDDSNNFTMSQPYGIGCISDKSIIATKDTLYFLGIDGFYAYQGGLTPVKISEPIKNYLAIMNPVQGNCAGTDGRFIYLSLCTSGSIYPNLTLKYDTERGQWFPVSFVCTAYYLDGTRLYGGTSDGRIIVLNQTTALLGSPINWNIELKPFSEDDETIRKTINRLFVVADVEPSSTIKVSYAVGTEGNVWTQVYASTNGAGQIQTMNIPVVVRTPERWYRIRIEGTGKVRIHRLIREISRRGS